MAVSGKTPVFKIPYFLDSDKPPNMATVTEAQAKALEALLENIDVFQLRDSTAGRIIVCNASGVPTYTAMKGDATLAADGTLSVADGAVTSRKFKPTQGHIKRSLGEAVTLGESPTKILELETTPVVASTINILAIVSTTFSSSGVIKLSCRIMLDGVQKEVEEPIAFEVAKSMREQMMITAQLPLTAALHKIEVQAGQAGTGSATGYGRMLWWLTS